MKLKIYINFFILMIFVGSIYCGINEEAGTRGSNFLRVVSTARGSSMGGAFVGIKGDISCLSWNPGCLGTIDEYQFNATYGMWIADTSFGDIIFGHPKGLGIGISYFDYGNFSRVVGQDEYGVPIEEGSFSVKDIKISMGYGKGLRLKNLEREIFLGITGKLVQNTIDKDTVSSYGIDIGGYYEIKKGLNIGLSMVNIGISEQINLGAVKEINVRKEDRILASIEIDKPVDNNMRYTFGLEYRYQNRFFGRIGYRGKYADWLTAGIGVLYKDIRIDYAYCPFNILGNTHKLSLGFSFGSLKN